MDEERALAESALAALGGAEGDVRDDDVGMTFDDVQTRDDANDDDDESDARKSTVFSGRGEGKRGSPSALAAWRVKALDLAAHAAMLAGEDRSSCSIPVRCWSSEAAAEALPLGRWIEAMHAPSASTAFC